MNMFDEYKDLMPEGLISEIEEKSNRNNLSKNQTKELLEMALKEYEKALIAPGESIGIVAAESFGESGTQMTLDVFHLAGVAEMQVTKGLPRLIEIFDARAKPETPIMEVHLKPKYTKDEKTIRKIASYIKQIKLEEISSEFTLNIMKSSVEVALDDKRLRDFGFSKSKIVEKLNEEIKGANVKELKKGVMLTSDDGSLTNLYILKEKAKGTILRGIQGITQVMPTKKDGKIVIMCAGTNLKEVLKMEEVDGRYTTSNDLHEIAKVLGAEAAREIIVKEASAVVQEQGLNVDIRHTMFLADLMTHRGVVKGITRGGITGEKESVLARASFETPLVHLTNASLSGEKDSLRSVVENVMLNQVIPLGTGLPGLISKMDKVGKEDGKTKKSTK